MVVRMEPRRKRSSIEVASIGLICNAWAIKAIARKIDLTGSWAQLLLIAILGNQGNAAIICCAIPTRPGLLRISAVEHMQLETQLLMTF